MKKKSAPPAKANSAVLPDASPALVKELREWIQQARSSAARIVDEHLCALYWRIGSRIRTEILKDQRAEYGAGIVSAVGRQLEAEFGRGFSEKSLRHMVRFAETFPQEQIVSALRRQLTREYGRGLGERHLRHCIRLAEVFADEQILHTLCSELSCRICA